jgi:hypothetical protein
MGLPPLPPVPTTNYLLSQGTTRQAWGVRAEGRPVPPLLNSSWSIDIDFTVQITAVGGTAPTDARGLAEIIAQALFDHDWAPAEPARAVSVARSEPVKAVVLTISPPVT